MNHKTLVEAHIRKELPELMAKVATGVNSIPQTDEYANGWNDCRSECWKKLQTFVHPITIAHHLRVLRETPYTWNLDKYGWIEVAPFPAGEKVRIEFNLTTQAPQSEEDWKKLAELFELV